MRSARCYCSPASRCLSSLDCDLRARADKHVATQQVRVHDEMFQNLAAVARRGLGPEQQSQIVLLPDMGGCAIRCTSRKSAGVAARWAARADTLPRAQRAQESLGYRGCWKQAWQELDDVTNEMCKMGVVVCDGMPAVHPGLHDVIAACPPAQLAHLNATLKPSPTSHERSRLEGKAGNAIGRCHPEQVLEARSEQCARDNPIGCRSQHWPALERLFM